MNVCCHCGEHHLIQRGLRTKSRMSPFFYFDSKSKSKVFFPAWTEAVRVDFSLYFVGITPMNTSTAEASPPRSSLGFPPPSAPPLGGDVDGVLADLCAFGAVRVDHFVSSVGVGDAGWTVCHLPRRR